MVVSLLKRVDDEYASFSGSLAGGRSVPGMLGNCHRGISSGGRWGEICVTHITGNALSASCVPSWQVAAAAALWGGGKIYLKAPGGYNSHHVLAAAACT